MADIKNNKPEDSKPKDIEIRPYARLLTMLGEQLIKNERIALMELIKNSYDADSSWVKINFNGFDEDFKTSNDASIIIEDAGHGMTKDVIYNHLAHPATPEKKLRKKICMTTKKGRVIQGEKGIGRFAILKLGRKIKITTRAENDNLERVIDYDFTMYDNDFLTINGEEKELFIDDLKISVTEQDPKIFTGNKTSVKPYLRLNHGTIIEVSSLADSWSDIKVENIYNDVARLQSIFTDILNSNKNEKLDDIFEVQIERNDNALNYKENYQERLLTLLTEQPVLKVEDGVYDQDKLEIRFLLNGVPKRFSVFDSEISGLKVFNEHFGKGAEKLKDRDVECGTFEFGFYVFDFRPNAPTKYFLDKNDKAILKQHRIYLYRDGIRVYPYGEPEDDWLGVDIDRGTIAASEFLSNDQVVGFVNISQEHNPNLEDKTNREGLIDQGYATEDFRTILRTILKYLRKTSYKKYLDQTKSKTTQKIFKEKQILSDFSNLKNHLKGNKEAVKLLDKTEKHYKLEHDYLVQRAETTEDLAGVGLSVETASHDIMAIMGKAMVGIDGLIKDVMYDDDKNDSILESLQSIRGALSFVEDQLKDIQLLFKSSKQRRKSIRVRTMVDKVELIYRRFFKKENINITIRESKTPLIAKTTDAVILQLLINMFDNAAYWLKQTDQNEKNIEIHLNGQSGHMIFSDNGPGIPIDDRPYIFEPFFTGKGEEGRGLGLFIARQLLERHDYSIGLADIKSEKKLSGANFVISFVAEE